MTILEAINQRHSVRSYKNKKISNEIISDLQKEIDACIKEGHLHIQLITNEPTAFDGRMAHYGKFSGVQNYIALVGKKSANLEEKCGYYGERIVLKAQMLGLNTCWVALTFSKNKAKKNIQISDGEKLTLVISLGYGTTQGVAHKSKTADAVGKASGKKPDWFNSGIKAALLAPTAMNQQKFVFTLDGNKVTGRPGNGFYTKIDLGIAKYHFEQGAGRKDIWKNSRF